MSMPDEILRTMDGVAESPIYKEFNVRNDRDTLTFNDLSDETVSLVRAQLTKLTLFLSFMSDPRFHAVVSSPDPWMIEQPQITAEFMGSTFVQSHIAEFSQLYHDWVEELGRNRRGFSPLNLGNIENTLVDLAPKSSFFKPFNFERIREILNAESNSQTGSTPEAKLLDLMHRAGTRILQKYYDIRS